MTFSDTSRRVGRVPGASAQQLLCTGRVCRRLVVALVARKRRKWCNSVGSVHWLKSTEEPAEGSARRKQFLGFMHGRFFGALGERGFATTRPKKTSTTKKNIKKKNRHRLKKKNSNTRVDRTHTRASNYLEQKNFPNKRPHLNFAFTIHRSSSKPRRRRKPRKEEGEN